MSILVETQATQEERAEHSGRVHGVDSLRGLAAAGIVLVHASFIHPFGVPPELGILSMGVPLFFMISAFSLSIAYNETLKSNRDVVRYAIRRYMRIAPLFYVIMAAWLVSFRVLGSPMPSWSTIAINLSLLFGIYPSTQLSLVPAGWSIGVEVIFYAIFPVISRVKTLLGSTLLVAGAMAVTALFNFVKSDSDYFHWTNFLTNLPYFAFGVLAYHLHQSLPQARRQAAGVLCLIFGLALILILAVFSSAMMKGLDNKEYIPVLFIVGWATAFCALILSQAWAPTTAITNRFTLFMGKISYSVYLIHPLLIYLNPFAPIIAEIDVFWQLKFVLVSATALIISIFAGSLLYYMVERPCQSFGKILSRF